MKLVAKNRDSNFELLRIISMFFVVTGHLVLKGANTVGLTDDYCMEKHGILGVFLYSVVVGGANLFVMITGWFGVKKIYKGIVRCIVDCLVFGTVSYFLLLLISDHTYNNSELFVSMMFTSNWFVVSYIMLLLVVPIIEMSLKDTSIHQLSYWLVLLFLFNVIFGYWQGWVNKDGYNAVQFIWLYYIARYLKLTKNDLLSLKVSKYGLIIFLLLSLCLSFGFVFLNSMGFSIPTLRWFSYNNPLLVLSCISLFLWISRLNFHSKLVNYVATGMFGVFLLHTTHYIIPTRDSYTNIIFSNYAYFGILLESVFILIVGCVVSLFFNKISNPVTNFVCLLRFKQK